MSAHGVLSLFVVYENPRDYPGQVVVREHIIGGEGGAQMKAAPHIVCGSVREARRALPRGLYRLEREPGDDPCIVEVWM